MKFSWTMWVIKGIELCLVRCPKDFIISGEKMGDVEEEKSLSKRKIVTVAWRLILLLFWVANLHFLLGYVRESLCFCSKGKLEEELRHCLHSKWPWWWREWALFQID